MVKKQKRKNSVNFKGVSAAKVTKPVENPFDKFANARKKHEVLNRKVKGEDRNVGRARAKAIDDRKSKLLKDFRNSQKSNSFVDKRFGEDDANLTVEEKMFMRFQQERSKKVRNSSLFNLSTGQDDEVLTHKGKVLGDSNIADNDWVSSDEEKGGLDKDVVNNMHFGGGLQLKAKPTREEDYNRRGKLDSLQEIVMKSKLRKMEKKEAREEQEDEREKIDSAYEELLKSSSLDFKTGKDLDREKRGRKKDIPVDLDDIDPYDVSLREMAFETKAKPSDRTKTDEEIALETREKIEELEQARINRMKAPYELQGVSDGLPGHGKKRVRTDDEIDDFDFETENKERNVPVRANSDEEENDELEGIDELGDEELGSGSDEDDDDDDESGDDDEGCYEFSDEENNELEDKKVKKPKILENEKKEKNMKNKDNMDKIITLKKSEIEKIPHKIDCPVDLETFDDLIEQFCRPDHYNDNIVLIDRILAWNNVHLPGVEGATNKGLIHNFLNVMLKHFIRLGDSLVLEKNQADITKQMNHLSGVIFTISQDIPEAAINLWNRTLKILISQLQKKLRDYAQGIRESCWPSLGKILLFQLLGKVFSITDYQNDITNPATIFLAQCLSQCPVSSQKDLSSGLLISSILIEFIKETKRFIPELGCFLNSVSSLFLIDAKTTRNNKFYQNTFNLAQLGWLRSSFSNQSDLDLSDSKVLWGDFESSEVKEVQYSFRAFNSLLTLLDGFWSKYEDLGCFPEMIEPTLQTLLLLKPQKDPKLPQELIKTLVELLENFSKTSETIKSTRQPLRWRKETKTIINSKAPKFDINYTMKKDRDSNQDQSKVKQLTRQLKREHKAAMRELRRDSDFIDQEKSKLNQQERARLQEERHKNYSWMEDQQATINQQVRKGKGLMKGGGSSAAKKPRISR